MYEVTWSDCGELFGVQFDNYRAAEALYFQLERGANARLWQIFPNGYALRA